MALTPPPANLMIQQPVPSLAELVALLLSFSSLSMAAQFMSSARVPENAGVRPALPCAYESAELFYRSSEA